jgi:hypothetical protein
MKELKGANLDIDFSESDWEQDECPLGKNHKCAEKNVSICKYFKGINYPDKVLCSYENDKS